MRRQKHGNLWCFFVPKAFKKLASHRQSDPLWGPARITGIIKNATTGNIWVWIRLFNCFFSDFATVTHFAPIRFYKQTSLRTETFTEQLLCADTLARRGLCTDKLLHADAFTHRGFYAKKFLYTDALQKDAFTRIKTGTQALLHTEPFTQKNLCTEQLLHEETFTQENFDTENFADTDCTKKFLHTETFTRRNFTQNSFYTQKPFRTEAFPHRSFYAQKSLCTTVFTQALLPKDAFTQKTFTQKFLRTAHFYTQPAFTRRGFASCRVPPLKFDPFRLSRTGMSKNPWTDRPKTSSWNSMLLVALSPPCIVCFKDLALWSAKFSLRISVRILGKVAL